MKYNSIIGYVIIPSVGERGEIDYTDTFKEYACRKMGNIGGKTLTLEEFKRGIRLMRLYLLSYSKKAGRHLEDIEVDAIVSAARHHDDEDGYWVNAEEAVSGCIRDHWHFFDLLDAEVEKVDVCLRGCRRSHWHNTHKDETLWRCLRQLNKYLVRLPVMLDASVVTHDTLVERSKVLSRTIIKNTPSQ